MLNDDSHTFVSIVKWPYANVKKHSANIDVLGWISLICTCTFLCCICVLGWNALSPGTIPIFQPEILLVVTMLLSGIWIDKWRKARYILPFIGISLIFLGLVILMDGHSWAKPLLCMGMGPILCVSIFKYWRQMRVQAFFILICCGASAGVMFAALPMIFNNYHIWPLLTSGLAAGMIVGFLRPDRMPAKTKKPEAAHIPEPYGTNSYLLIAVTCALTSLGTGVSYKWFFIEIPLPALVYVVLICVGLWVPVFLLMRQTLFRALNAYLVLLVVLNLMQLIAHEDCSFTNAASYFLFGMYFSGFFFLPRLIWQDDVTAFRSGIGLSIGFICLIIVPRTLSTIMPPNWLFETQVGWILQTILLTILFFSGCFLTRGIMKTAFENTPFVPLSSEAVHNPLLEELTKREHEVAILVLQGKTNREIARHLHIAESTVKTHIANLLGKAQCNTKTQFIMKNRL